MSNIQWSESGKQQVKEIKKMIVKKKIMLGFMIDDYSWWDRRFRYLHTGLATIVPLITFVDKVATGSAENTAVTTLVLSSIVAGMIKLKDTLKFGKIVSLAQQQTIKYKQLFQRIEREMYKQDAKRQTEDDFIYWVNREYNNIEMSDPELTHNMKKKFAELCKSKNIPYDEDMDALASLLQDSAKELTNVVIQKATEDIADAVITDAEAEKAMVELKNKPVEAEKSMVELKDKQVDNPVNNPVRIRSTSDEQDRAQYKETMKKFNPTEDMQWALDRLTDINT